MALQPANHPGLYFIWALSAYTAGSIPPPNEALQYHIYDDEVTWKRNLRRSKGLARRHQDMLHTMQLFNSDTDANYLGWINRLAKLIDFEAWSTVLNEGVGSLRSGEPAARRIGQGLGWRVIYALVFGAVVCSFLDSSSKAKITHHLGQHVPG